MSPYGRGRRRQTSAHRRPPSCQQQPSGCDLKDRRAPARPSNRQSPALRPALARRQNTLPRRHTERHAGHRELHTGHNKPRPRHVEPDAWHMEAVPSGQTRPVPGLAVQHRAPFPRPAPRGATVNRPLPAPRPLTRRPQREGLTEGGPRAAGTGRPPRQGPRASAPRSRAQRAPRRGHAVPASRGCSGAATEKERLAKVLGSAQNGKNREPEVKAARQVRARHGASSARQQTWRALSGARRTLTSCFYFRVPLFTEACRCRLRGHVTRWSAFRARCLDGYLDSCPAGMFLGWGRG